MKTVLKRNGSIEPFDIEKIQVVIDRACLDLEVYPSILESSIENYIKEEVSTEDIQNHLISIAQASISLDEPDWNTVAGRLYMQQYRKNVIRDRQIDYSNKSFVDYLYRQLSNNIYSDRLLEYDQQDFNTFARFLRTEKDLDFNLASAITLINKFMLPEELPQEAFLVTAMMLNVDTLDVAKVIKDYYYLSSRKISLATPSLSNIRKPNGNLSSCFIFSIPDNLEGITDGFSDAAKTSKEGGGLGVFFGYIRASGSTFRGMKNKSVGTLPFIKIFNDIAVAVNQGKLLPL